MAAYPSFAQLDGSLEDWVDDLELDRAVNGSVKVRAFYAASKRRFTLKHRLDSSDRATLQTFYNTNRLLAVDLTWNPDGQVYSCMFEGPPKFGYVGLFADITVHLAEQ